MTRAPARPLVPVVLAAVLAAASVRAADLDVADGERIVGQAVAEAEHLGVPVAIAVLDRQGNQLVGFRMTGVCPSDAPCEGPTLPPGRCSGQGLSGLKVPPVGSLSG